MAAYTHLSEGIFISSGETFSSVNVTGAFLMRTKGVFSFVSPISRWAVDARSSAIACRVISRGFW